MKKNKSLNCTQRELYAVCTSAWNSCFQNIEKFNNVKPKYTGDYAKARLADVEAARLMPDRYRREGDQQMLRLRLKKQLDACLEAWRMLQSSIGSTWEEQTEADSMLKAAGQPYYRDAYNTKWEACQSLMDSGKNFIATHKDELLLNDNMSPSFVEKFNNLAQAYDAQYNLYMASAHSVGEATDAKQEANQKLLKFLRELSIDAKIAFKDQPALLNQFIFDKVLLKISGQGAAGIKGMVSNGQLPVSQIQDLELVLVETGDEAFVDTDGSYRFSQLASGTYTLRVTAPGYKEQAIPGIHVNTASYTTQNIVLEKEPAEVK